jgi:hypothetical protein
MHSSNALIDVSIQYDHRHLMEVMVKVRDQSIQMLKRWFFGLSGTCGYFLPSYLSGDINMGHVNYLIGSNYWFMNSKVVRLLSLYSA